MKITSALIAAAALSVPALASAGVTLSFDRNPGPVTVYEIDMASGDELDPVELTLDSVSLKATATPAGQGARRMVFVLPGQRRPVADVYLASPAENVDVTVKGDDVVYAGTPLMEGVGRVKALYNAYGKRYAAVMKGESDENPDALEAQMTKELKDIIAADPKAPAVPYVLLLLDGDDFMEAYAALDPSLKQSVLMPAVEKQKASVEKEQRIEQLYRQLESGAVPAPAFSLPDPQGNMVTLADFRGKWVILDFWGSWCGWCIKGIPELKEAYAKYKDRLEVVGIDCRDDREDWLEAIKKYELPWVHVYNDTDNVDAADRVDTAYGVQGFPTKVIIDPEGYVKKIVVGEDPAFYTTLADFLK